MANWQNRLNIGDLHQQFSCGEIDVDTLGREVARRIRKPLCEDLTGVKGALRESILDRLERIALEFEQDVCDDVENYDYTLNNLYDLGDMALDDEFAGKKLLWVETS